VQIVSNCFNLILLFSPFKFVGSPNLIAGQWVMYAWRPLVAMLQWRRLQPVGVRPCKYQNPQAEACAT
jgi:hypothetical protein